MTKLMIFVLFFMLIAFSAVNSGKKVEKVEEHELSTLSSPGQSQLKKKKERTEVIKDKSYEKHVQESTEALTYQKGLIRPYLDMFLENPVKCEVLKDNEQALEKYKRILEREDCPDIEKELDLKLDKRERLSYIMNAKLEKDIQEITKGRICFRYPNPTTFKALVEIWKKYPCSEAAIASLGEMNDAMQRPHINISGQGVGYKEEMIAMYEYIIENYPDSWQVEAAKKGFAIRKYGYVSEESMRAHENWLDYVEQNKLYKDASCYDNGKADMIREYDHLARIYNERFNGMCQAK